MKVHKPLDYSSHTLDFMKVDTIEVYRLTVNKSSFDAFIVIFDVQNGKLCINSDYGDAIYSFDMRSNLTLRQIADIDDISYFAEKCVSSPKGRGYPDFDMNVIINKLKERYETLKKAERETEEDISDEPDPEQSDMDVMLKAYIDIKLEEQRKKDKDAESDSDNYPTWNEVFDELDIRDITSEELWYDYVYRNHCVLTTFMNCDTIVDFMNCSQPPKKEDCICDNFYEYLSWGTVINDQCYHHLDAIHEIYRQLIINLRYAFTKKK